MSKNSEESLLKEFEEMLNEDSFINNFDPFSRSLSLLKEEYFKFSEWSKMKLLKYKKLPSRFISYIIDTEHNELILNSLAENPFLSPYFIKKLLFLNIKNIDFSIASHRNCDLSCQNIIIARGSWSNIGQLALNPNTKLLTLKKIYNIYRNHNLVLTSISSNPNLDIDLISKLAKTYNRKIVLNLLKNPLIPAEILWNLESVFSEELIKNKIQKHQNYNNFANVVKSFF